MHVGTHRVGCGLLSASLLFHCLAHSCHRPSTAEQPGMADSTLHHACSGKQESMIPMRLPIASHATMQLFAGVCHGQATFVATPSAPSLSLMAPIMPSPDWIVGLHHLKLCQHGQWVSWARVPLFPYDLGTHEGTQFAYSFEPSDPRQPVQRPWSRPGNMFRDASMCDIQSFLLPRRTAVPV